MLRIAKLVKMKLIFLIVIGLCHTCYGHLSEEKKTGVEEENVSQITTTPDPKEDIIESYIQEVEQYALDAEKLFNMGDEFNEDVEQLYSQIVAVLDDISEAIKDKENIIKFIKAKGLHRLFSVHLHNTHTRFRTRLLLLLKDIFNLIPGTIDTIIPINILDRLLNIFEDDDNLAVKAHTMDVLNQWLPKNPIAQVRVMKIKGLDVFYKQINKLDIGVVETLMDLFNSIIKEHLEARNEIAKMPKLDERLVTYERIGLVEHLSTPNVCGGLLNIFTMLWSYNSHERGNIKIFYELLKNIKPFCSKIYMKKPEAVEFFQRLLTQAKDESKNEYFEVNEVNVADFVSVIEDYLGKQKEDKPKDEF